MKPISIVPIGRVLNEREKIADDNWGEIISELKMDLSILGDEPLKGLEEFSHVEVIFFFNQAAEGKEIKRIRHPRDNTQWPRVGVLAQRAKDRINHLGISRATIVKVTCDTVIVKGLDAINNTPILDIKPYMREFGPLGTIRQPSWAIELMKNYY